QLSPMNPTFQPPKDVPPVGSPAWMRWFQNEMAGVPFDKGAKSTDYSLQMAAGIANFYDWKCQQGGVFLHGGNACDKAKNIHLKMLQSTTPAQKVYKIERDPVLEQLH
ncbi:MAG TPA: hypothetical protein VF436_00930, partial [Dyella sp.]